MKNVLNYFVRRAFGVVQKYTPKGIVPATPREGSLVWHLRRIQSNIAAVYDWLRGRLTADHLPARLPMPNAENDAADPLSARYLAENTDNLLTHLRLLDGRKITNGYADGTPANDGLPDGISLARIVADASIETTALVDDNVNWDMKEFWVYGTFKNLNKLVLNCRTAVAPTKENQSPWIKVVSEDPVRFPYLERITGGYYHNTLFDVTTPLLDMPELVVTDQCRFGGAYDEINLPKFERVGSQNNTGGYGYHAYQDFITSSTLKHLVLPSFNYLFSCYYYNTAMIRCAALEDISLPVFDGSNHNHCDVLAKDCPELKEIIMPKCVKKHWHVAVNCPKLEKVVFGTITGDVKQGVKGSGNDNAEFATEVNLIHLEIGEGSAANINFGNWNPSAVLADTELTATFLSNFRQYIADRLADRTGTTTLTLTLSQAVYDVVMADTTIAAILANKNWTVAYV